MNACSSFLPQQTGHRFTENEIFADVGDTVGKSKSNNIRVTCPDHLLEFLFYPANHSVIRAPYLHPCIPYEMSGIGRVGFNSGFKPVKAITTDVRNVQSTRTQENLANGETGSAVEHQNQRHRTDLLLLRCGRILLQEPNDWCHQSRECQSCWVLVTCS